MNVIWAHVPMFSRQSDEEQLKGGFAMSEAGTCDSWQGTMTSLQASHVEQHCNLGAAQLNPEQSECKQHPSIKHENLWPHMGSIHHSGKSYQWDFALIQTFSIWNWWPVAMWGHWALEICQLEKCLYFNEFKWVKYFSNTYKSNENSHLHPYTKAKKCRSLGHSL